MGADRTGLPWSRGYVDLERGRPMFSSTSLMSSSLLDRYGSRVDFSLMQTELHSMGLTLDAMLLVLNKLANTNISKEEME